MIIFPKRLSQHSREKQYNSGMCSLYVCVMRTTWNIFWAACLLHVLRGIPELLPVQGYACVRKWIRGSLHSLHRHALMLCNQPPFKEAHQLNFLKGLIEMQTSFQRFNEKYCFYWSHVYEGNKLSKKWGVKCFDVEPHAFMSVVGSHSLENALKCSRTEGFTDPSEGHGSFSLEETNFTLFFFFQWYSFIGLKNQTKARKNLKRFIFKLLRASSPSLTCCFLYCRWRAAAGARMSGEADSAPASVQGGVPAETGADGAGSGLGADSQPSAGRRTSEEEGVREESGEAAECAGPAAGRLWEAGRAGAPATHEVGAGAKKPQGTTGEENKPPPMVQLADFNNVNMSKRLIL